MQFKEPVIRFAERYIRLPPAGLDISDRNIKYVKFSTQGGVCFELVGEIEVPEGIISNGEIRDEEELVSVIRRLPHQAARRLQNCGITAALPEEKSFLRLIQIPKAEPEQIPGAIRWAIEGQVPFPPDEVVYDYEVVEPLRDHLDHIDVVVTAFPKSIVESYVRVLKKGGMRLSGLELESQAIARSAVSDVRLPSARLVIDMGRTRTSFIILAGGAVIFTKTVSVGGLTFEGEIGRALGLDQAAAIRIKKELGLDRNAYEGRLFAALSGPLDIVASELRQAIAYYENHVVHIHGGAGGIGRLLLSGGDANLIGLDTYLASRIRIQVQVADPLSTIKHRMRYPIPSIPQNQALAFTAAIGLALRGFL